MLGADFYKREAGVDKLSSLFSITIAGNIPHSESLARENHASVSSLRTIHNTCYWLATPILNLLYR